MAPSETHTLSVKVHRSAMERLRGEAAIKGITVSEHIRMKLGITNNELLGDSEDDRFADLEKRLSRLEEMAGL